MTAAPTNMTIVCWKDLDRWVIPLRRLLSATLPRGWTVARVGDLVSQVDNLVKVTDDSEYKMAGVRWYGEGVFHRETVRGCDLSARAITPLVNDAFIYNRLFAWKGSFAVVSREHNHCFVSNEFPQFVPDRQRLLSQYLYLFCMCDSTNRSVCSASTGSAAVSRNRFKEEFFYDFDIPLPPLPVQEKIVSRWQNVRRQVFAARRRADEVMAKVDARFCKDLGLAAPATRDLPKVLAVPWTRVIRWGVSYNQHAQTAVDLTQGKYPVVDLGSVLAFVQYGTSEKANTEGKGTPIVRMNNIKDGRLNLGDLKHIELSTRERSSLLLDHDDILINRTNSKELVGKCAVFHEDAEYVFASYLIRLRVDPVQADPQFVSHALNTALGRQQIDAVSRQIIGQANINTEEIRALQIPLPRVTTQRGIMERVQEGRAKADALRTEGDELAAQATTEVEEMILGTRPVA